MHYEYRRVVALAEYRRRQMAAGEGYVAAGSAAILRGLT